MKRTTLGIAALTILSGLVFSACQKKTEEAAMPAATEAAAPAATDAAAPAATTVVYTCPMHPEVNQAAPGKCSACGMDLVQKS